MPNFPDITSINLGNTFGGWYNKTNEIITRVNSLDVASVTGGDGISVLQHSAVGTTGGFTVEFSGNVTKNTTFNGNVIVSGTLTYGALNADITGTQLTVPYATGVTVGNVVYVNSTGLAQKAKADDECTSEVIGVVTSISGANAIIATTGRISGASMAQLFTGVTGATFVKGAVYFLSAGVSGYGVTAEPDVVNYISKPVLVGITGDTALILPYRGFIANNGISGISSGYVAGITNAVLSLNGASAAIRSIVVDPATGNTTNIVRTTGNMHAVTALNRVAGTSTLQVNPSFSQISNPQISDSYIANYSNAGNITESGTTRTVQFKSVFGNSIYNLFGTLGGTSDLSDVYKLHRLRIIPLKIPTNVICLPFTLYRVYNRYGGTNYIQKNGINSGPVTTGQAAGEQSIETRMKNYVVKIQDNGTNISQTVTPVSDLYTPIYNVPFLAGATAGLTGDGITAGDNTSNGYGSLSSSSPYAVVYGPASATSGGFSRFEGEQMALNRTYGWSFNSVILNEPYVGEYIESAIMGTDANTGSPSGFTMDNSILGWNAMFGAVPETIAIGFPSLGTLANANILGNKISLMVVLELYSYNPTSGVTGSIFRVPVTCTTDELFIQLNGSTTTLSGVP
jgi:hypothetical protein